MNKGEVVTFYLAKDMVPFKDRFKTLMHIYIILLLECYLLAADYNLKLNSLNVYCNFLRMFNTESVRIWKMHLSVYI